MEKYRGTGVYSRLLQRIERVAKKHGYKYVMIENVLNAEQYGIYLRRGYAEMETYPICFVKEIQ